MKTTILSVALFGLFACTSCETSDEVNSVNDAPLTVLNVESDGTSVLTRANVAPIFCVTPPLTADEIEFLYAMREDEKLSRDLYTAFAAQYPAAVQIGKIASAEGSHIACVEAVLDFYEIDYPPLGANGLFADPTRQARYTALAGKGATLVEAYSTLVLLEEETLFAYQSVAGELTNANLALVMANQTRASSNHLKATMRQLTALGGSYVPQYFTAEAFKAIIDSAMQGGNAYGQQKGQGGKGGNTNSQKGGQGQGKKGSVNGTGTCTGTGNGAAPGQNSGGGVGKGYRGGR